MKRRTIRLGLREDTLRALTRIRHDQSARLDTTIERILRLYLKEKGYLNKGRRLTETISLDDYSELLRDPYE